MHPSANEIKKLPNHIAIIMDGNGRWATRRGLSRKDGHLEGSKAAKRIIGYAHNIKIKYLTLYAFSMENWQRPKDEIDALMDLLDYYLKSNIKYLIENSIKLQIMGDLKKIPNNVLKNLSEAVDKTKNGQKMVLTLALSYSSWSDLLTAVQKIPILKAAIDENTLKSLLASKDLPCPDLMIRTGGEKRLSNFMLLELSYTELYFCAKLWPDFSFLDFDLALEEFHKRERRFGNV